jgi:hypothetical protein
VEIRQDPHIGVLALDIGLGLVDMHNSSADNSSKNLLLRFLVELSGFGFEFANRGIIQIKVEQPVDAQCHNPLWNAQLNNLVQDISSQIPAEFELSAKPLL